MYFITRKDSETGKKFQSILERAEVCIAEQKKIMDEVGATEARCAEGCVWGGISSLIFPSDIVIDKSIWKPAGNGQSNEWLPKKKSEQGRLLAEKIAKLPKVRRKELNDIVGYHQVFGGIGFNGKMDSFFGFSIHESWFKTMKIPEDCKEITFSEYDMIFNSPNPQLTN